jgi:hypothetical protein
MAKVMAYTDPNTGAVFPQSCWVPVGVYVDFASGAGRVVFNGYATPDVAGAALAYYFGLSDVPAKFPVAQKEYVLGKAELLQFASAPPVGASHLDTDSDAAYALAAARLDVPAPTQADPSATASFFAGATDVALGG